MPRKVTPLRDLPIGREAIHRSAVLGLRRRSIALPKRSEEAVDRNTCKQTAAVFRFAAAEKSRADLFKRFVDYPFSAMTAELKSFSPPAAKIATVNCRRRPGPVTYR